MKILYLTDEFPPESFGGAGIMAYDFAKAVAGKGHEVMVFRIYSRYIVFLRHYLSVYNPFLIFKIKKIFKKIKNYFKITAWQNIKIAGKRFNPFRNIGPYPI